MIAMALACSPSLVIADEPTTALDVMVQAQVLRLMKELQNDLGLSMIFITHDLSVLVETSDRLAIMYAGRIVEEGPAEQVSTSRSTPTPRRWRLRSPRSATCGSGAPTGLGGSPDPTDVPSRCSFHPRCPKAFDECPEVDPPLFDAGPGGRRAACRSSAPRPPPSVRSRHVSQVAETTGADAHAGDGEAVIEVEDLHVTFEGRVGVFEASRGKKAVESRA